MEIKKGRHIGLPLLFLFAFPVSLLAFELEGRVRLEGKPPEPAWLEVDAKHHSECGKKKLSTKLKVSPEGFVANAVVKLEGNFPQISIERYAPPKDLSLDQIGCEFVPHILLVPEFNHLRILNSDGFLHNVRAFNERAEMLFNDAMPKKGQVLKKQFNSPGRYILRCGVHSWMHAVVIVQEHRYYALTDATGHFKIDGIPEGNYRLKVWHESLGELETEASPDQPSVELTYPAQETR